MQRSLARGADMPGLGTGSRPAARGDLRPHDGQLGDILQVFSENDWAAHADQASITDIQHIEVGGGSAADGTLYEGLMPMTGVVMSATVPATL